MNNVNYRISRIIVYECIHGFMHIFVNTLLKQNFDHSIFIMNNICSKRKSVNEISGAWEADSLVTQKPLVL